MNVFFRELKSYWKNLLFWSIGMVFLIGAGMAKYEALKSSGQTINDLMNQFPQSIQTIFGLTGFDLTKASGYFGVLFMYIGLMAAVHAVLLGADLLSKEERDKTSEFLFVKPISRSKIISGKIMAGLFCVVIFNFVTWLSSLYFVGYFNEGNSLSNDIFVLMNGLVFMQLIFFFVGTCCAAVIKKPKLSSIVASSILLFCFILTFIINLNRNCDFLKYLTPFKYFDAKDLLKNGELGLIFTLISVFAVVAMVFVTYRIYSKRDLNV